MRKLLVFIMLTLSASMMLTGVAWAEEVAQDSDVVTVDVSVLAMIAGLIIPVITGVVTTKLASSPLKAVVTAVLAIVAGVVATAIEHSGSIDVSDAAIAIFQAAVVAWASYAGFWKPTTIAPQVQSATPDFGIGKRTTSDG